MEAYQEVHRPFNLPHELDPTYLPGCALRDALQANNFPLAKQVIQQYEPYPWDGRYSALVMGVHNYDGSPEYYQMIEHMLKKGANPNWSCPASDNRCATAHVRKPEILLLLLRYGARLDVAMNGDDMYCEHDVPLLSVLAVGDEDTLVEALKQCRSFRPPTLLHHVACYPKTSLIGLRQLIKFGADPTAINPEGKFAYEVATKGHFDFLFQAYVFKVLTRRNKLPHDLFYHACTFI